MVSGLAGHAKGVTVDQNKNRILDELESILDACACFVNKGEASTNTPTLSKATDVRKKTH